MLPTITKVASSKTGGKLSKQAKKSALEAGIHSIGDISSGKNVKSSISKNLKKAKKDILNRLDDDNRVGKKTSTKFVHSCVSLVVLSCIIFSKVLSSCSKLC